MAPLAPPLLKYLESSESTQEAKLVLTSTDENQEPKVPSKLHKSHSQNKFKRLAPMATIDPLKTEPESDENSARTQSNTQKPSTNSSISTKSTSTAERQANNNQQSTSTTVYYSNQHYHRSKQHSTSNNRKQMTKVCLNPDFISDMINFNSLTNEGAVQEGLGVAGDLKLSSAIEGRFKMFEKDLIRLGLDLLKLFYFLKAHQPQFMFRLFQNINKTRHLL
jgi:hypothetical protein